MHVNSPVSKCIDPSRTNWSNNYLSVFNPRGRYVHYSMGNGLDGLCGVCVLCGSVWLVDTGNDRLVLLVYYINYLIQSCALSLLIHNCY